MNGGKRSHGSSFKKSPQREPERSEEISESKDSQEDESEVDDNMFGNVGDINDLLDDATEEDDPSIPPQEPSPQ